MARPARLIRPDGPVPYDDANGAMHDLAEARLSGRDPLDSLIRSSVHTRWPGFHRRPAVNTGGCSSRMSESSGSRPDRRA